MAIRFGWFDVPLGGDATKYYYSADEARDLWRSLLTNGIVPEVRKAQTNSIVPVVQLGTSLAAGVGQGLKLIINRGIAWIDGAYCIVTEPEEVSLQAGWTNDVVLRLDTTGSDVVFGLFAKQRGAASIEAGLTRAGGIYELGLHTVVVPADCTQITAEMITDHRLNMGAGTDGEPCCGIIASMLTPDIDAWYRTATAKMQQWYDNARSELDAFLADQDAWFAGKQTELDTYTATQKKQFEDWFATLKSVLSGDIAGNLYNMVANHASDAVAHITAAERAAWSAKASPARTEYHTLTAAGWTAQEDGTSTQVITLTGTTIVGDPPIDVGQTPTGMTAELMEAISAAQLLATSFTATTVTITAFGTPPAVDVPIFITIAD